ncbi:MAG TPA: hypothetical protein VGQ94_00225 [Terriglobales bacterium]|nr:hypothetical protein [Terriglobales bacterium]
MTGRRSKKERGVALLIALFALLLLSAIAFALMYMADTEQFINDNYRAGQKAYYAAVGGLQDVRERMFSTTPPHQIVGPAALPGVAGSILYVRNPLAGEVIDPTLASNRYFDDELCHENFPGLALANPGVGIPCTAGPPAGLITYIASDAPFTNTAAALEYKWVRITLKANGTTAPFYANGSAAAGTLAAQVCWDGTNETLAGAPGTACPVTVRPVFMITSLARTASGARRMVQQEIAQTRLPPLPGALTLDGPAPVFGAPNSNPYHVNGNDTPSCGVAQPPVAGIAAYNAASVAPISAAIPRPANYTGAGGGVPNVVDAGAILGGWGTPQSIESIIASLLLSADQVLTGPVSNPPIGTDAAPLITVINGDATFSGNTRGAGILIITGTATMSGNSGFNGIVLVVGKGVMNVNGGGNGSYNGGVLIAKTRDALGNVLPTMGAPTLNWNGGGGNGVYQDSCWLNKAQAKFTFQIIATREEMY